MGSLNIRPKEKDEVLQIVFNMIGFITTGDELADSANIDLLTDHIFEVVSQHYRSTVTDVRRATVKRLGSSRGGTEAANIIN